LRTRGWRKRVWREREKERAETSMADCGCQVEREITERTGLRTLPWIVDQERK